MAAYPAYPVGGSSSLANTGSQTRRFALWDPSPAPDAAARFITASGDSVRLYEVEKAGVNADSKRRSAKTQPGFSYKALAVKSDLPQIRCLAWSAADPTVDLIAAGITSGRTLLFSLPRSTATSPPSLPSSAADQVILAARNSRPCSSAAFDPTGHVLAIGLEKARDFGLQVFDVERAAAPLRGPGTALAKTSPTRPFLPRSSTDISLSGQSSVAETAPSTKLQPTAPPGSTGDGTTPMAQTASSEAINAVCFTHASPSILLAAASSKIIRQYDLRSTGLATVAQWSTRSVLGLEPDPFLPTRFASWGDDGVVRIWDTRKASESMLMFSEENAGSKAAASTTGAASGASPLRGAKGSASATGGTGIASVAWSRTRSGVLAVLPSDGLRLRFWDIVTNSAPPGSESMARDWTGGAPFATGQNNFQRTPSLAPLPDSSPQSQSLGCSLFSDTASQSFSRPIRTMVAAHLPPSLSTSPSPQHFLGVARDGHIEILEHRQPGSAAFGARGDVVFSSGSTTWMQPTQQPPITNLLVAPAGGGFVFTPPPSRHRSPSIGTPATLGKALGGKAGGRSPRAPGTETPRPALRSKLGSSRSPKSLDDSDQYNSDSGGGAAGGGALSRQVRLRLPTGAENGDDGDDRPTSGDVGRQMIRRIHAGYGADPSRNGEVALREYDRTMEEFWAWVTHADNMAHSVRSSDDTHDFDYQGVLPILSPAPLARGRGDTSSPPPTVFEDITRTLRRGDELRAREAQLSSACASFNRQRGIEPFVAVSSGTKAQRQLALAMCGPDYVAREIDGAVKRHEEAGRWSIAAGLAFFSGSTQRAIKSLQRSDDPQLKLLGPILATHLSTQQQGLPRDSFFVESVRQLASDRSADPHVRAMLSYIASGDWRDVTDEGTLPLRDRVACALRFLGDEDLFKWLEQAEAQVVKSGELDGVVLTGLAGETGMRLLQQHVNRTGDVQTAALAAHLVVPGRVTSYPAERWIATYRGLLDRWRLFNVRARFDVARGKRIREAKALGSGSGRGKDGKEGLVPFAPPGLWMRCQYCNENISVDAASATGGAAGTATAKKVVKRTTQCPSCHKTLPKCSVCLLPLGIGDPRKSVWAWCHRCRHSGHSEHLQQWRDRGHAECPVAGCDCECWSSGRKA